MGIVNPYRQLKADSNDRKTETSLPVAKAKVVTKVASQADHNEELFDESGALNPRPYGGSTDTRSDVRAALASDSGRMFDAKGEINAYDKRDALQQIAYLMQNVTKKTAGKTKTEAVNTDERRKILAAAMRDPSQEGFAIVGQELLLPIKDIIDYEGWVRKIFRVRPLAQGELFRIAKDVRSTAWVVGQDGQGVEARLHGKYVMPNEFKIAAFPSVDIAEIYQMNYDVLDRAQDTARQEIELEEDKRGLSLLDRASTTVNAETIFTTLGVAALEDLRYQVERHRLVVEKFLINRRELSDMIKTAVGLGASSQHVDPVTERELILAGYVGNVLNCQIITAAGTGVEEVVPAGTVYAVTGSEYLGEMGIRIELFSEPYNKFSWQETVKGWAFMEQVGFVIPNSRAVAKASK
jgi:hypothetical protein